MVFIFFASLFSAKLSLATSFFIRPLDDRMETTPVIVRGIPQRERATWLDEGNRRTIVTMTELDVLEVLKGDVDARSIEVIRDGGELDGVAVEVPGSAALPLGKEVILFLIPTNGDQYRVRGMSVGAFRVTDDGMVIGAVGDSGGNVVHHPDGHNVTGKLSLEAFRSRLLKSKKPEISETKPQSQVARTEAAPKLQKKTSEGQSASAPEAESQSKFNEYWVLAIAVVVGVMLMRRMKS